MVLQFVHGEVGVVMLTVPLGLIAQSGPWITGSPLASWRVGIVSLPVHGQHNIVLSDYMKARQGLPAEALVKAARASATVL